MILLLGYIILLRFGSESSSVFSITISDAKGWEDYSLLMNLFEKLFFLMSLFIVLLNCELGLAWPQG
jgi:hypothetical protein